MLVTEKCSGKVYEVFDVSYDHYGYPKFLIYKGKQWIRSSAKHFIPLYFREESQEVSANE